MIELLKGNRVYIQTHNFPDPDALASAYGLQRFLLHFGIESTLCYDGQVDKLSTRRMLGAFGISISSADDITDMTEKDYIVTVDSQALNSNRTDFIGNEVACIDHHPVFVEYKCAYSDIRIVGACATLITEYFMKAGLQPTADEATALAYGIKVDTEDFNRGVTQLDIDMFAWLYNKLDSAKLQSLSGNNLEFQDLRAYGAAIETIRVFGRTGFAYLPFACPDALIGIISDFILSIDVVEVAVVYSVRPSGYKFSIRSEDPRVNAGSLVASVLSDIGSGGGHSVMAGGFVSTEKLRELGENPHDGIVMRFSDALRAIAPDVVND